MMRTTSSTTRPESSSTPRAPVPTARRRSPSQRPWWTASGAASTFDHRGSQATLFMVRLKWLVDRKVTPHIPVWDKSTRSDGTFSRTDFVFDQERNIYVCPGGAELTSSGNIDRGTPDYRASKNDCSICFLKPKCT